MPPAQEDPVMQYHVCCCFFSMALDRIRFTWRPALELRPASCESLHDLLAQHCGLKAKKLWHRPCALIAFVLAVNFCLRCHSWFLVEVFSKHLVRPLVSLFLKPRTTSTSFLFRILWHSGPPYFTHRWSQICMAARQMKPHRLA